MIEREVGDLVNAAGSHPNLVQYKCSFVEKHKLYLVMEFCADGDLHDYLTRHSQQKMSWLNVLSVLVQVAAGVAFLHKLGIAHRDISLENIMLHHGIYKLGDFGIATRAWGAGGYLVGKNCYMAPEIVEGNSYDPKAADVWSLGIVVFILLTGSPLVSLASTSVRSFCVLKKAGVKRVLESWGIASSLPKSALDLLSGMLGIDPTKRLTITQVCEHAALKE
ncbi:Serine/threonine protein kinase [Phytophthora palmivora]|uniref:Serine/threonine protein kinase n=1 Tax=Phytophthora palmivora TaxID=4796 RepID=A0A2P4Y876_9STRA|nr:Serine/threonine protein kinase [Phytophthora palmivora]